MVIRTIFLTCFVIPPLFGQDVMEILRASMDNQARQQRRMKDYSYQVRKEERVYGANGKVKSTETATLEFAYQSSGVSVKMTEKNGRALSPDEISREQRQLEISAEIAVARSPAMRDEFINRHHWEIEGTVDLDGRPTWITVGTSQVGNVHSRYRAWIDQMDFETVRSEMELGMDRHGLLPAKNTTKAIFEMKRMEDGVWLPKRVRTSSKGRAGLPFEKDHWSDFDVSFSNYKKFQSDSRLIETP